jgi:hypothetical protein
MRPPPASEVLGTASLRERYRRYRRYRLSHNSRVLIHCDVDQVSRTRLGRRRLRVRLVAVRELTWLLFSEVTMRCLRIFATPGGGISFDDVDDKAACSSDAGARKAPISTLAWAPRQ